MKILQGLLPVEIWYLNKLVNKKYNSKAFKLKKIKYKKIYNFLQLENEIKKNN